jgi:hypothetical protein
LSKNGHWGGSFATWQRCNKQRLHDVAIGPLKNAVLWVGTNDCHAAATAKRFCPNVHYAALRIMPISAAKPAWEALIAVKNAA